MFVKTINSKLHLVAIINVNKLAIVNENFVLKQYFYLSRPNASLFRYLHECY